MEIEVFNMRTELAYSFDMDHTYSINRVWDEQGKQAIIIMLYPTIGAGRANELDSSTCLLLNHMRDFELGGINIVNLYSKVFNIKPGVKELNKDVENLKYLEEVFSDEDIKNKEVIIAWGSAHASHKTTMEMKVEILNMMKKKKISAKQIAPEYVDETMRQGIHPLYLGLHHSREKWSLLPFDVEGELSLLTKELKIKDKKKKVDTRKGNSKDVLQDKE